MRLMARLLLEGLDGTLRGLRAQRLDRPDPGDRECHGGLVGIDWRFSRQPSGSARASAAGAKVTGEMKVPHPGTYSLGSGIPIEGNVAGDVFTFQDLRGVLSGDVAVGGDDMVGRILSQWGVQRASLHRGSALPQSGSTTR